MDSLDREGLGPERDPRLDDADAATFSIDSLDREGLGPPPRLLLRCC